MEHLLPPAWLNPGLREAELDSATGAERPRTPALDLQDVALFTEAGDAAEATARAEQQAAEDETSPYDCSLYPFVPWPANITAEGESVAELAHVSCLTEGEIVELNAHTNDDANTMVPTLWDDSAMCLPALAPMAPYARTTDTGEIRGAEVPVESRPVSNVVVGSLNDGDTAAIIPHQRRTTWRGAPGVKDRPGNQIATVALEQLLLSEDVHGLGDQASYPTQVGSASVCANNSGEERTTAYYSNHIGRTVQHICD